MKQRIGIIGGSGLYDIEGIRTLDEINLETPFGAPSDALILGELEGREVVFLPRHGRGHRFLPTEVNYRANIWAMKKLGVDWILSVSAVGSLKEELKPKDVVLVDQFVDRTHHRKSTFFGNGIVGHIMFAHPVCDDLRTLILEAAKTAAPETAIHFGGTYVNMEGPAFSTKSESNLYRSWGMDVIGMTNLTEAKLAREAEICYATMAMVTDYDCWREEEEDVNVEMIIAALNQNVAVAKTIIKTMIPLIPRERNCECAHALANAIMTPVDRVPEKTKADLDVIMGKYFK